MVNNSKSWRVNNSMGRQTLKKMSQFDNLAVTRNLQKLNEVAPMTTGAKGGI